jgi:hypothetical protein
VDSKKHIRREGGFKGDKQTDMQKKMMRRQIAYDRGSA